MSDNNPIPTCPKCGTETKLAPVQGYSAGIPWSMHLRAYDAYCKKYGPQQALIEGWCRGGFGVSELDMFIPGWRDELLEVNMLRRHADDLTLLVRRLCYQIKEENNVKRLAIDYLKRTGRNPSVLRDEEFTSMPE